MTTASRRGIVRFIWDSHDIQRWPTARRRTPFRQPGCLALGETPGFADRPHDRVAFFEGMEDNGDDRAHVRRSLGLLETVCLTSAVRPEVVATPRSRERRGQEATRAPWLHTPNRWLVKTAYYSGLSNWLVF